MYPQKRRQYKPWLSWTSNCRDGVRLQHVQVIGTIHGWICERKGANNTRNMRKAPNMQFGWHSLLQSWLPWSCSTIPHLRFCYWERMQAWRWQKLWPLGSSKTGQQPTADWNYQPPHLQKHIRDEVITDICAACNDDDLWYEINIVTKHIQICCLGDKQTCKWNVQKLKYNASYKKHQSVWFINPSVKMVQLQKLL